MAEDTTPDNAPDGGQQSDPQGGDGTQPESTQDKTFTQAQLDAILADRLGRERQKYADYDEMKKAAAEWHKVQDAQKSDLEKLQESLNAAQAERDQALSRANDLLIRSAFISAGAEANLLNPLDAYRLADLSAVTIEEDGSVKGVDKIVKKLVADNRLPLKGKPAAPSLDGGAGTGQRPGQGKGDQLSEAERQEIASIYGLNPKFLPENLTK